MYMLSATAATEPTMMHRHTQTATNFKNPTAKRLAKLPSFLGFLRFPPLPDPPERGADTGDCTLVCSMSSERRGVLELFSMVLPS